MIPWVAGLQLFRCTFYFYFFHHILTIFRHCGIRDPSWSELHHFVSFLNKQLQDFEVSTFCGTAAVEDLPGFAQFVLRFLIQMSRVYVSVRFLWIYGSRRFTRICYVIAVIKWGGIESHYRFNPTTFLCLSQARTWISNVFLCSVSSVR